MDKQAAALGSSVAGGVGTCLAVDPAHLSPDERILVLEEQMRHMQRVIMRLRKEQGGTAAKAHPGLPTADMNKDGLPIGTVCMGATEKSPFLYYLTVEPDSYRVGSTHFESLSAAAEAVSLVRRSGWAFWKLLDGRTLKEAFRG
jgi:hypothetical protein